VACGNRKRLALEGDWKLESIDTSIVLLRLKEWRIRNLGDARSVSAVVVRNWRLIQSTIKTEVAWLAQRAAHVPVTGLEIKSLDASHIIIGELAVRNSAVVLLLVLNLLGFGNHGDSALQAPSEGDLSGGRTSAFLGNAVKSDVLEQWTGHLRAVGVLGIGVSERSVCNESDTVLLVEFDEVILLEIWVELDLMNIWLDLCNSEKLLDLGNIVVRDADLLYHGRAVYRGIVRRGQELLHCLPHL